MNRRFFFKVAAGVAALVKTKPVVPEVKQPVAVNGFSMWEGTKIPQTITYTTNNSGTIWMQAPTAVAFNTATNIRFKQKS